MSDRDKSEQDKPEQQDELLLDKETLRDLNLDEETAEEVKGGGAVVRKSLPGEVG